MATRSSITICEKEHGAGEVYKSVYCHLDGYTQHNGILLLENYSTEEKVRELISHGDMSSLAERIAPNEGEEHSFDKSLPDVCVFYHRDRGEAWEQVQPIVSYSEKGIFKWNKQEYNYLFQDGKWYWNTWHDEEWRDGKPLWKELTEADCRMRR